MVFPEQTFPLSDGRVLMLRPPLKGDAQSCIDFLKTVGGETDYLLCDGNGIAGLTLEGEEEYLAASRTNPDIAMYLGFVEGELVSVFDLRPGVRDRTAHMATLSLAVRKAYWHLGIGTIAMEVMTGYARTCQKLKLLTLDARSDNARAIALYRRFGFRPSGVHKGAICIDGDYYDMILMDLAI
jgi:RimJ/RimL family protein N-acetyltransferase